MFLYATLKNNTIHLFKGPSEGDWFYYDPDHRIDDPQEPHCCRCKKKFKKCDKNYVVGEVGDGLQFRVTPTGKDLMGIDCYNKMFGESMAEASFKSYPAEKKILKALFGAFGSALSKKKFVPIVGSYNEEPVEGSE